MSSLSLSGALALIALAYNVLLACKLLSQSGSDTIANALLATVCLSMGVWSWSFLARDLAWYASAPDLLYAATPAFLLLGPALLAYTKRVTVGTHPFERPRAWLHLTPFALFVVLALPFYSLSADEKLRIYQGVQADPVMTMLTSLLVPHMVVYTLLCLAPVRRYEAMAQENFSDLEHGNLRWLKRLCIGMLVLLTMDISLPVLSSILHWPAAEITPTVLIRVCLLLYTVFLAFSALGQPPFQFKAAQTGVLSSVNGDEQIQNEKYARSGLRDDSARYYLEKLHILVRDQKVYLDCGLTLRTLAGMLKLRPHHLSQILNEQVGKSFYDFINELRVAHAKELLTAEASAAMSILDIAFASGYNNKVSFYNAFKRFAATTPTRYREDQGARSPASSH